jgi:hypothetical protein
VSFDGQKLFNLLPALYRLRDAQIAQNLPDARGPLESLLALIAEQIAAVEEDLDQLYDDQFIETCAPWVIPYIGDLIGYRSVKGVAPAVASPRAEVAHTISFRRRKARSSCSSNSPVTSPDGARMRWSFSRCWPTPST